VKAPNDDDVAQFFRGYPPDVNEIAVELRGVIRSAIPDAREMLDTKDRVVGYGFGPGYADLICTIIPSKTGVKLGLVRGAQLPDPDHLLEGGGKQHRYVPFKEGAQVRKEPLQRLLASAVVAWRERSR
jgi:hypothetical protein